MGVFGFLPKFNRCCFCTRNLKVASVFIIFWSMFAAAHEISVVYSPTCRDQYDPTGGPLYLPLIILKWFLYALNLAVIASSFAFLLGKFVVSYPITADVFICCGIATAVVSFFYAIFCFTQLFFAQCSFNMNDVLVLLIYFGLWVYFILIVNSYRETIE